MAASTFGANLEQWDLGNEAADTPEQALANFAAHAGGVDALQARVRAFIEARNPDLLLSFDPRSGVTCHPDHRAAAALTLQAARQVSSLSSARIWLLESKLSSDSTSADLSGASWVGFAPVAQNASIDRFDASADASWRYLLADLGAHQSQFSNATVQLFTLAPTAARAVFLLPFDSAQEGNAAFDVCP
ncbi:MAG: hypothetical protein QM756_20070 [Polyangiaceae bacterium]